MKKSFIFWLVFLANTLLVKLSYGQTANITEGCAPLEIQFTAPDGYTEYFWDFKDNATSTRQNPVNLFNNPGTYEVEFSETPGGPVVGTVSVTVFEAPLLDLTVDPLVCIDSDVEFNNSSTIDPSINVSKFIWVFGDGQRKEGENPVHKYSSTGVYDISLEIETDIETCNRTKTFPRKLEATTGPTADFLTSPNDLISCNAPFDVAFTNVSSGTKELKYTWDLGNGNTSTTKTPARQTYEEGQFVVSLDVEYVDAPKCKSSDSKSISVGSPKPEITLSKDSICVNASTIVSTETPGITTWDYGSRYTFTPAPGGARYLFYDTAGIHTITLTVTSFDGRCSGTTTRDLYVEGITAEIESSPNFSCESPMTIEYKAISNGEDLDYFWSFESLPESLRNDSIANPVRTYMSKTDNIYYGVNEEEPLTTELQVVSKKTGCKAFATVTDTMWLPNSLFMPNKTKGCAPLSVMFSDSSESFDQVIKYEYIYGDGKTETYNRGIDHENRLKVNHVYQEPGEYEAKLVITTERGCVDTSYAVTIEVGDDISADIDFTADKTEVCPGDPVELSVSQDSELVDGYHFQTEENRSFHCSNEKSLTWTYGYEAGPQDVNLIVDYNGCLSTVSKAGFINVKGAVAKIDYEALCSAPYTYTFTSESINATDLTWDFADGETSDLTTVEHTFANRYDYNVVLTAQNGDGCQATTDTAKIKVREVKAEINIDTLICINSGYDFSGAASQDVYGNCFTGYTWQFPDLPNKRPHTSGSPMASFSFGEPGVHTAMLIVKDVNGCKDTATAQFKVYDMEVDILASDWSVCSPTTVEFEDATTADTTKVGWLWEFGDLTTSEEQNPEHTYTIRPGGNKYIAYLTVTDELGCEEKEEFVIDHYIPKSTITASSLKICEGDSIKLTASDYTEGGSYLTYSWDFDNGETSTEQSPKLLYEDVRDYNVTLNFEEFHSKCKGVVDTLVQIQRYPEAGFYTDMDEVTPLCAPKTMLFTDTSKNNNTNTALTYYTNFGNGQTSTRPDGYALTYDKGTYAVEYIVRTSFGCADTANRSYTLYRPEARMEAAPTTTICKGEEVTFSIHDMIDVDSYTWYFGDGDSLNNTSPVTHEYNFHPPSGITEAELKIKGIEGCEVVIPEPITIHQVIADFQRLDGVDSTICFNDGAYTLTNTSENYDTYKWEFGDGQTSAENSPSHQYETSGVYDVTLMIENTSNTCKDTTTKKVFVYQNPEVTALGDTACLGTPLNLMVANPEKTSSYSWTPTTGLSDATDTTLVANLEETVTYQVIETDTNSCTGVAEVPAIVVAPIGLTSWDTTIIVGDIAEIPAVKPDLYIFNWMPEEGLSCTDCNYPTVQPLEDINYVLTVTDSLGCFESPVDYTVYVKPETFVKLPTTFSPNGDGNNDIIYVKGWGIKELLEFKVFNRWGQEVFSSSNINEGWNGKFNGVVQNSDMYVYKVKVRTWRDEELYDEGYINLIH